MRDELILFCRSAGLPTVKEPENLIPDDPLLRPADLYIPHWTIDGQIHSRHAVDFTAPSIDSAWVNITQLEQDRRCSTAGFMTSSAVNHTITILYPLNATIKIFTIGQSPSKRMAVLLLLSVHF